MTLKLIMVHFRRAPQQYLSSRSEKRDCIDWKKAENLILDSDLDVFAIFDCCFADGYGTHERPHEETLRTYELLTAGDSLQRIPAPGTDSFTSALIWALKSLAPQTSFDTEELTATISRAPRLQRTQRPLLFRNPNGRRIIINQELPPDPGSSRIIKTMDLTRRRFNELYLGLESVYAQYSWLFQFHDRPVSFRGLEFNHGGLYPSTLLK